MKKAAIYARYSSDNQREASIEDQVRVCREELIDKNWDLVEVYSDHGVSGASMMRPGLQALIQDALAGRFEIVVAEALDRLSRDQEDVAGIYKRLNFSGVTISTLSEGEISQLHIGLKGTMNALYLKDLAEKTHRGLRGRVEAGRSGGGNSYGYDVIKRYDEDGNADRGERKINKNEAKVIKRIFTDYANGLSPRNIVKMLNTEGIPGPSGKSWGPSTVHGNRKRGTGILNNELYIGRLVWNRLTYVKDPDTGKRISRLNPEGDWIVKDVPDLQIVDLDLWSKVKERQDRMKARKFGNNEAEFWDRRRPRHLFSGLMKCGVCGGSMVNLSSVRAGCANARNKGTCTNSRTIRRELLEETVLNGLKDHLMDPELCGLFAEEYAAHTNRLRIDQNASIDGAKSELEKVIREIDRLLEAIMNGVPGDQVKDKISKLEERKAVLLQAIENSDEQPVLIHPEMGRHYRKQVSSLSELLCDEKSRIQAAEIIRSLVDVIVITPEELKGKKSMAIDLYGDLAGILTIASNAEKPLRESDFSVESAKLVAGAGFEPATFRL